MFRTTEQHDHRQADAFAFTMLNIYFTFAEFLIIWSGNVPDEIPWYLQPDSTAVGGQSATLDALCHWVIPFCLLAQRASLKRFPQPYVRSLHLLHDRCPSN